MVAQTKPTEQDLENNMCLKFEKMFYQMCNKFKHDMNNQGALEVLYLNDRTKVALVIAKDINKIFKNEYGCIPMKH